MTIREWLTPDFFALNVILVTIMINWTLYSIVSNFLEDFHIPERVQAANYFGVVVMTAVYFILTAVLDPIKTIYPNRYDWLLIGNWPVFGGILAGVAAGAVLGYLFGGKKMLRIGAAGLAVVGEGLIGMFTLLWILNQQ
ncbi:MAG TPA: hypothetical protein VM658_11460 [bacterium]|nr:hypothetical protein [bacterium]